MSDFLETFKAKYGRPIESDSEDDFLTRFRAKYGRPIDPSPIAIAKAPKTVQERSAPKPKPVNKVKVKVKDKIPRLSKADLDLVTQRASAHVRDIIAEFEIFRDGHCGRTEEYWITSNLRISLSIGCVWSVGSESRKPIRKRRDAVLNRSRIYGPNLRFV
jgi:hypothetical protein